MRAEIRTMVFVMCAVVLPVAAQSTSRRPLPPGHASSQEPEAISAIHMVGLQGVGPAAAGSFQLTTEVLEFASNDTLALIPYHRITSVYRPSHRELSDPATAGTQNIAPRAGGTPTVTVTPPAELLILEWRDAHGQEQAAVFVLPLSYAVSLIGKLIKVTPNLGATLLVRDGSPV